MPVKDKAEQKRYWDWSKNMINTALKQVDY
jgi:hypothetical protein